MKNHFRLPRRPSPLRVLFLAAASGFAAVNARAVSVGAFDPATWQRTDATPGVTGFTSENFEDTTLWFPSPQLGNQKKIPKP